MLSVRRPGLVAVAASLVALAGCGGNEPIGATVTAPVQRYAQRDPAPAFTATPTPADYRRPIAAYKAHVRRALRRMSGDVAALGRAVDAGDLRAARSAWLRADADYESIGAAYGAFGELDAAINAPPGGDGSPQLTGLHRVELALWKRASPTDARRPVVALGQAVARLERAVPRARIDPLDYSLRAHEVLEDTLHLQLAGVASPWSGAALTAVRANVAGTRVVLSTLTPMLERRNPTVARQSRRALDRLEAAVDDLERHGRLPRWPRLPQRDQERIGGLTAAAAEQLAFVPELIDPRPLRPSQRATGGSS
jgi:iron uptake system EfeUOB component EfeO/EfeM